MSSAVAAVSAVLWLRASSVRPVPRIELRTEIRAPAARVFDLARSVELHVESMRGYGAGGVGGVTSGLVGAGQEVTWRARHFGLPLRLTSRITLFEPPLRFRDEQVRGPFAQFAHDHRFDERDGLTQMNDVFDYRLPLGPLGALADRLLVRRRLTRLLGRRAAAVKEAAELD